MSYKGAVYIEGWGCSLFDPMMPTSRLTAGTGTRPTVVVAIPVRNERDRIVSCLSALVAQEGLPPGSFGIVLFANNCTDDTCDLVRAFAPMPWPLRLIERTDPAASAGWARRIAMDAAAEWLAEDGQAGGILLTTDADSRVSSDWVARNLACIAGGADAVAGRISLEPHEAALLPSRLHARGRLEAEYEAILTEIGARLDPEPGNPWPCHWSKSGATLAARLSAYRAVGGMPDQPAGEDHAFVDAIRARDLIVRHDPSIEVITSGRLDGRATGGVADTIKHRCDIPDSPCDDRLERAFTFVARCLWRRLLRRLHANDRLRITLLWAPPLRIPRQTALQIIATPFAGQALSAIEAASPRLVYRPVRPSNLPRQIVIGRCLLFVLRTLGTRPITRVSFETSREQAIVPSSVLAP